MDNQDYSKFSKDFKDFFSKPQQEYKESTFKKHDRVLIIDGMNW